MIFYLINSQDQDGEYISLTQVDTRNNIWRRLKISDEIYLPEWSQWAKCKVTDNKEYIFTASSREEIAREYLTSTADFWDYVMKLKSGCFNKKYKIKWSIEEIKEMEE